ncbi:hypothetical protein MRS44_008494 [Fusarium solani]|uniref:uncharacterized protein n=1 Tax=Fusarium solani TaxID=169388 RepID=UPI0032C4733E|nr:hypothetical protein MRS44_008494 [Fusarium solani]
MVPLLPRTMEERRAAPPLVLPQPDNLNPTTLEVPLKMDKQYASIESTYQLNFFINTLIDLITTIRHSFAITVTTAVTNEVPMSDTLCQPNPRRHGRQQTAHPKQSWLRRFEERLKELSETLSRKARRHQPKKDIDIAIPYIPSDGRNSDVNEPLSRPEGSKAELASSHSTSETESPGTPPQSSSSDKLPDYLFVGSFVRRKGSKHDAHPYLIIRIEEHENGKTIIWACLCTSRPKLKKLREQYENREKKHFIYLGGEEATQEPFEPGVTLHCQRSPNSTSKA